MAGVRIIGTGSSVPLKVVKNDDLKDFVDTNDEWIRTRTGISERRVSTGESTADLAVKAARNALINSKLEPKDIDLIIVATTTPDYYTPSTACLVQKALKIENAAAFDIYAACSGFIFALDSASSFIKSGNFNTALIIGSETLSRIVDWKDRGSCILFGDGAGAAVLCKDEKKDGIYMIKIGSDGSKSDFLKCRALPLDTPFIDKENDTLGKEPDKIRLDGREVFKFAVNKMSDGIKDILEKTGFKIDDIKYIVPHQANERIIEAAARKLSISEDKFYMNIDKYGNTSGASIPIALDEMNRKGILKSKDKIILIGFGGGMTFGYALIEWN